jgi:hypothetical protein
LVEPGYPGGGGFLDEDAGFATFDCGIGRLPCWKELYRKGAKGRKAGTMNLLGVWKTPQPKLCDPLRPLRLCGKSSWMGAFGVEGAGLAAIVSA